MISKADKPLSARQLQFVEDYISGRPNLGNYCRLRQWQLLKDPRVKAILGPVHPPTLVLTCKPGEIPKWRSVVEIVNELAP